MNNSTDMWFRYITQDHRRLTEGLRDIGLPEYVTDYIESAMPSAPEKSKVLIANLWKNDRENRAPLNELQFTLVNALIEDYKDYVYATELNDEGRPASAEERTLSPWDPEEPNRPRVEYDAEMIEKAKKIKFVIQNLKSGVAKPFGTWRKTMMKAIKSLSKAGLPSEKVETTKEDLSNMLNSRFRNWWNRYDTISAFLNDDPTNYELAKDAIDERTKTYDANELLDIATNYLNNKEDPDKVIHTFDDGSYWYNLETSNCPIEAERMGHCGADSRGWLVSLRKRKGKRKSSSSYVTLTWGDGDEGETLYQIKGRSNDCPPEEVWPHIEWFIDNMNIQVVEETGEHSNNPEDFELMNEWLASRTQASFHGNIEEIIERVTENVENIDEIFYENRDERENCSIGCTVEDGTEMGGNPRSIYLYMSGEADFQINLGWPGFDEREGEYLPTDGPESTVRIQLEGIPTNTYGREARDFEGDMDLDDIAYSMPGEDAEVEWRIEMMQGEVLDPAGDQDPPATAHLLITMRSTGTGYSDTDDPGDVSEYDSFADEMRDFDESYDEFVEKIRRKLVEGEYIAKTAYDRAADDLIELQLENFKVYSSDSSIEFWFSPTNATAEGNLIFSATKIPTIVKQYIGDSNANYNAPLEELYASIFGGIKSGMPKKIETETLKNRMAQHIQKAYAAQERTDPRQLQLPLGAGYEPEDPQIVLAQDSRFIIVPQVSYSQGQQSSNRYKYPDMGIAWKYTIGVDYKSPDGEIDIVKDVVQYLDKNPQLVISAANEIIEYSLEPLVDQAVSARNKIMDNQEYVKVRETIKSEYGASADTGDPDAEKIILMLAWFEENYSSMSEIQRFVMWKYYLNPLVGRRFRHFGPDGQIELDDDSNIGMPRNFKDHVYMQAKKLGAIDTSARSVAGLTESIEDQIARVDSLLSEIDPTYDLRLYNIQIGCTVSKDTGGTESETATEIRGVAGVTTVRPVAARKRDVTPTAEYILYDIKFELLGAKSRVEYRDEILLPALRKIRGLKLLTVSSIHRTNRKGTIRTVRESKTLKEYGGMVSNFGGVAGGLGAQRSSTFTKQRPTPRMTLQKMVDDWRDGGVMAYDAPTDTTDMRYHTMMPVAELLPYISTHYRGDKRDFEGRYRHFIRDGAKAPVYVAIGQNGRVKITGGEDLIWFAKKSGLKELPVFFSYQKQV